MTEAGQGEGAPEDDRRPRGRRAAAKEQPTAGSSLPPDETMQLKVDALRKADETMQLNVEALRKADETMQLSVEALRKDAARKEALKRNARDRDAGDEGAPPRPDETMALRVSRLRETVRQPGRRADRRKPRGKPTLPPAVARVTAAVARYLAPLAARTAPYARKLKPVYPRPGRTGWRRWMPSWRQWLGAWLTAIGLTGTFLVVAYAVTDIPDNLNSYATQQDNVYFWSDGTPMARTGWVQRQAMPLKDIPQDVRWAVLAAENESFYSDPGISFKGITRALWRTVGEGDTEGGSTITQQYVKNVYLNQNQTVSRKFTEAMISLKLDNKMSKDQILEGYLNTSWFGRGTYGIQRAAQAYYGKDVSKLNASEAACLAGLLKGAGLYDPTLSEANHKRAVERWSWILDRMVKIGKLSPQERAKYTKFPDPLKVNPLYDTGEQSDYLVELASQYAKKSAHITDKQFDLGGYQIYTTFDRKREKALTSAVTDARKQAKKDHAEEAKTGHYGAASVADDGRILAVYGGPDHRTQGYNESNSTTVKAGSAFQPFVYAAGLEHGVVKKRNGIPSPISPETLYDGNDGHIVTTPEGPYWDRSGNRIKARNDGGRSYGDITLDKALAQSVNVPFMQLGMDTGLDKVTRTAEASGLLASSIGPQVPALSAGNSTPSAIRMASGYATFAASGTHTEPYSVRRITRNGAQVALATPRAQRAVGAEVAQDVSRALTESFRIAHPAGAPATAEVGGKAGTTEDDTASWYTGTASSVTTAVVVYRIDLAKSLEPLPLKGLAGTATNSVPYTVWSKAMGFR